MQYETTQGRLTIAGQAMRKGEGGVAFFDVSYVRFLSSSSVQITVIILSARGEFFG